MKIKNISKSIQFVMTVDWKKDVKAGEIFEAKNDNLLRLYPNYFEEVKSEEIVKEKKVVKEMKKK